ncbi:hypothetical protein [uncultured Rubinisphaera sp.]|uniref:hypothetical protein n=1 Tax=uncultured Rubinisphaera sp. TaxID=1678686 RepID=UPI0030DBC107|tara:strand:- start:97 stop:345 length:249 start_codon:yes stop_codon:yes gene_type:complete
MTTQEELEYFYYYASQKLSSGDREFSLRELFNQWQARSSDSAIHQTDLAAIRASLEDLNQGESGQDADVVINKLRQQFNTTS